MDRVQLDASWKALLQPEFEHEYMRQLRAFLLQEKQSGKQVYPAGKDMFNALNSTPFDRVCVVILGQDPTTALGRLMVCAFPCSRVSRFRLPCAISTRNLPAILVLCRPAMAVCSPGRLKGCCCSMPC